MKLKTLKILTFSIFLVLIFSITVCSSSWYIRKNSNHLQPEIPRELKDIEKYDAFWCDLKRTSIDDTDKIIYLTFDAGYENGNISKVLDILKEENVKGNFFILSNLICKNKDLVQRMIDDNHVVANHTSKHKDITKFEKIEEFKEELEKLENLYENEFGCKMGKFFRPPEGKFNEQSLQWAKELGYKTVFWSFAYEDWDNSNQMNKQTAIRKIIDNIHNGEVMLLHPTSDTNVSILKELIIELKSQGFKFGDLKTLCSN